MDRYVAIILLVLIILVVYWVASAPVETFTAISGISNPLTTYDDYGTFNFLFHTDDFPYYDPTYHKMGCMLQDYQPSGQEKKCGRVRAEDFNHDSFIQMGCHKIRRELVPSNYTSGSEFARAGLVRDPLLVKKDRPQASSFPPQPHNIYFSKVPGSNKLLYPIPLEHK